MEEIEREMKIKHEVTRKKQKCYYCMSVFSMCIYHHWCALRKRKARSLTLAKENCLELFLIPKTFSLNCAEKQCEGNIKTEILKKSPHITALQN